MKFFTIYGLMPILDHPRLDKSYTRSTSRKPTSTYSKSFRSGPVPHTRLSSPGSLRVPFTPLRQHVPRTSRRETSVSGPGRPYRPGRNLVSSDYLSMTGSWRSLSLWVRTTREVWLRPLPLLRRPNNF